MPSLKLRRINCAAGDAAAQLAALRAQLGAQGNVVSARGRELTQKVFGEPLPPAHVVERICEDVRNAAPTPSSTTPNSSTASASTPRLCASPERKCPWPTPPPIRRSWRRCAACGPTCCRSRPGCCTATPC